MNSDHCLLILATLVGETPKLHENVYLEFRTCLCSYLAEERLTSIPYHLQLPVYWLNCSLTGLIKPNASHKK